MPPGFSSQSGADVSPQHALIVLISFLSHLGLTAASSHRSRYSLSVIFAPSRSRPGSRSRNFLVKYVGASRMGPWIVRLW